MSRKELESLLIWLTAALLINAVAAPLLVEYSRAIIEGSGESIPYGMTKGEMLTQSMYIKLIANYLVNFVIAFWVFKTTSSKRILWVAFSLLAGWWSLPLFIFYHYYTDEAYNQKKQEQFLEKV